MRPKEIHDAVADWVISMMMLAMIHVPLPRMLMMAFSVFVYVTLLLHSS
jgi:hypothetical protein